MKKYLLLLSMLIFIGAVYPVRHAAGLTFGYTGGGATDGYYIANYFVASKGTSSVAGTASKVSAYLRVNGSATTDIKAALFTVSGTTFTRVDAGSGPISKDVGSVAWHDFPITSSILASTVYYSAVSCTVYQVYTRYDNGSTFDTGNKAITYADFPAATYTNVDAQSRLTSIYATYTPSAPPAAAVEDPPIIIIID